jgi:GDPmannose 4,6-dehydratase
VSARRALITGVTGQDGSYLAELLVANGYAVTGVVRGDPARALPNLGGVRERVELVPGDLSDPTSLPAALARAQPDEVYHLAAPTFVPASWEDPATTLQEIATATATLLHATAQLQPPPRVYVATSSEVFGDAGLSPQDEETPMRPHSPYGVAKLAAHRLVGVLREHRGLFACAGITYNHESVRRPERFLPRKVSAGVAAIKLGLTDELVLGDLEAVRDWTAATDVVRGAWLALQADEPDDYVFASGVGRTVRELARVAFDHVGLAMDDHVRVDEALVRADEGTPLVGDPSKARRVLGWEPQVSFEELIGGMVDFDLARLAARGLPKD